MFHAKYEPIGSVVLEKKSFERCLPYMGMAAILNFRSWLLSSVLYHYHINAEDEISLNLA